ncbi:hypothetical protein AgCh_017930 [Apium graveolens]
MEYKSSTMAKKLVAGVALVLLLVSLVSAVEEKAAAPAPVEKILGRVGVCLNVPCKDSALCDELCKDGKYIGGICLPPSKHCCCLY